MDVNKLMDKLAWFILAGVLTFVYTTNTQMTEFKYRIMEIDKKLDKEVYQKDEEIEKQLAEMKIAQYENKIHNLDLQLERLRADSIARVEEMAKELEELRGGK